MTKTFMKGMVILMAATTLSGDAQGKGYETATFAGGCFWCMEEAFSAVPGVIEAVPGYTGGETENPTYEEVCSGTTGHLEAVRVVFDPSRVSYRELLDVFWRNVDPTDASGQFADRGPQYKTAIFAHTPEQEDAALKSKAALEATGRFKSPVVTPVLKAVTFYPAEEYHQNYGRKNPSLYRRYRSHSGRNEFLSRVWGQNASGVCPVDRAGRGGFMKPPSEELRKRLSPRQFEVTQNQGTEPPFQNEYWDNHREGIYVDVVSGEPLFSSRDKFDSGTGWPSFTRPLVPENIVEKQDDSFFMKRTEVKSARAGSHLGHVFPDGPPPTGLRYCINSASLRFIPREDLEKEGYGSFLPLFEKD